MKKYILLIACLIYQISYAQRIGVWKVHLPQNIPLSAAEATDYLYVGTHGGLYSYDLRYGEVKVYSKSSGLSDIEVSAVRYSQPLASLVIAYGNANIDILKDGEFYNVNDIFKFPILGKKYIYDIYIDKSFAYLSCSFGIAKLDIQKREIVESYQNLGPKGENIEVNSVTINGDSIYAATNMGLISASINSSNLADFNQWNHWNKSLCQKVVTYKNKIYTGIDSIVKVFDGTQLTDFIGNTKANINAMETQYDKLIISRSDSILECDEFGVKRAFKEFNINQTIAIKGNRLVSCSQYNSLFFIEPNNVYNYFTPNGPNSNKASDFAFDNTNMWVAPEGPTSTWILSFNPDRFFSYNNAEWDNHIQNDTNFNGVHGIWKTAIRPYDSHIFMGSWGTGLLEYSNKEIKNKFNYTNSPLQFTNIGGVKSTLIGGMAFDTASNLWFTNAQSSTPLGVYTKNGVLYNYNLGSIAGTNDILTDVIIDDNNYKWIILPRSKGLVVYNDNGTLGATFDDQIMQITSEKSKGFLPDMNVRCAVKDKEGNIWVGTDKGLTVFYTPGNVFSGQNFDAQQIIISKNGKAAYLFGDLSINHIAIDAGNRKWIATRNGVYLISADGQNIIFNFNKSNSPLLSDYVQRIGINPTTGEVFFATDQGIVSYQGDALPGIDAFEEVIIYPNPVKQTYDGLIAIKGVYNNANVKITDISGNIIYETRANGSVATWNGKNFKGEKAYTGIYLVFCSNADGSSTYVGKILFIH